MDNAPEQASIRRGIHTQVRAKIEQAQSLTRQNIHLSTIAPRWGNVSRHQGTANDPTVSDAYEYSNAPLSSTRKE